MEDEELKKLEGRAYSKGYAAGRAKHGDDIAALEREIARLRHLDVEQKERVYMQCLEMALKHCAGWQIGGKTINNAEGYCKLAKVFAENSISELNS